MERRLLEGRYALVTGASRGIGRAIAERLASSGCNVALTSRKVEESEASAKEISQTHSVRARGLRADVSNQAEVADLFQQFAEWSGRRLDVLVNNAGYPFQREIWDTPLDESPADRLTSWYLDVFRTDTLGAVFCTREALQIMRLAKAGSIVFISSTPALEGYQGTPYTVAKAGILGLMKDVAREYGRFNIRANALCLGNIQTPATFDNLLPEQQQELAREAPLERWGRPEEVGQAAVFLASDQSSFITGQTLIVDGGTLRR